MEPLIRFRTLAVRISIMLLGILALLLFRWDAAAAHGMLLGGLAGVIMFWMRARRLERLSQGVKAVHGFQIVLMQWVEWLVYAAVLYKAYTIAPVTMRGFWAACAGLFVIRLVALALGLSSWDVSEKDSGESQ